MINTIKLALNDLRLTIRDRWSLFWMLIFPILLMWFFGQVFDNTGQQQKPKFSLTVVNHDDGWLSRLFVEELDIESAELKILTPEEAETAEGKVRTLVIPAGFTEAVLAGEKQELRLEKEPGTDDDFALAAQVHIVRTIVRTIGRLVEINQKGGETIVPESSPVILKLLAELASGSEEVGQDAEPSPDEKFRQLGEREKLVGLSVTTAGSGTPVPSGTAQSVPGILTMSVLMGTLIYGAVFLTGEKQDGTLRRQLTMPVGRRHVLLGKLLGRLIIAFAQIVLLLSAGYLLFGITYGHSWIALSVLMCGYALAVAGLAMFLGAVLKTSEQAGALGWILAMGMSAVGGCWWPSELMPRWLWNVAHVLPTAWAMDGFHNLISFGRGIDSITVPTLALLLFGAIFTGLGIRFLKTEGI